MREEIIYLANGVPTEIDRLKKSSIHDYLDLIRFKHKHKKTNNEIE